MTIEWSSLAELEPTFSPTTGQSDPLLLNIAIKGNSLTALRNPYVLEPQKYQAGYVEYYDNSNNGWASVDDKTKFWWTYLDQPTQPEDKNATS